MRSRDKAMYLLCNDDGVQAPGINVLAEVLRNRAEVVVSAPHLERSGSSSAISIMYPILVNQVSEGVYGIEGTPADAAMIGLQKLTKRRPDWLISGINRGGNLGSDTVYSGTVGAAVEGCFMGVPSMAVSIEGREPLYYETAAKVVEYLLTVPGLQDLACDSLVNVNVPNVPWPELKGIVSASLGRRIYHGLVDERLDPRGRPYFWMGPGAKGFEKIQGSDCMVIQDGFATVTILRPDLYDSQKTQQLSEILRNPANLAGR